MTTQTVTLSKGENINIEKTSPGLTRVRVGLGWDVAQGSGAQADLDAWGVAVGPDGKAVETVYYGHKKSTIGNGCISLDGDNRTGAGDGDDETLTIDLATVPENVDRIPVIINIHEGQARRQNFGQVRRAGARLLTGDGSQVLATFDLSEDFSGAVAVEIAQLYRHNGEWKFKPTAIPAAGGIKEALATYGATVG